MALASIMRDSLPAVGLSRSEIFARMEAYAAGDIDWRRGRVPLYVFKGSDDIAELGRDAFVRFFTENGLGAKRAFHGFKRMEDEVVAMGLSLFHAPDSIKAQFPQFPAIDDYDELLTLVGAQLT